MSERNYLIATYSFLPFGPARMKLMLKYFDGAKNVWNAKASDLREIGLSPKIVNEFVKHRDSFDFDEFSTRLKKLKIKTVTADDDEYPSNLVDLDDAPYVLYYRGEIKKSDSNAVAIVGSRKMTSYGREVSEMFASELGRFGVTIVSGLAFGVDLASQKAAVDAGGRAIAVLASGVDDITPRSNSWLGEKIIKSGGAVVSEYPPGTKPNKAFFPFRNRIISGLSKAVVIVEGREKSGTLHTANHAAKQGREVFAVPGPITSPLSEAPHYLIKNGARFAFSARDVLEELDLQLKVDSEAVEKILPSDDLEEKILKIIENEEKHADEIARELKLAASEVSSRLTMMELKGLVKMVGGLYRS